MAIKEITIYDIARQLRISSATVSRALQGHSSVKEITRQRVVNAAKEMGYRYNAFAGKLRKQKTNTIAVMLHELNSSFITSVLAGIEKVTAETGYDLIITHAGESSEKEAANALNLFHKRVDGVIASLAIETKTLDHFTPFIEKEIPVIFFDRVEEFNKMPKVIIDNYKCGYIATRHLIEQGCTRIAHITSSLNRNVYAQRYLGYRSALEENGIAFQEEWLIINDLKEESAIASAQKLLTLPQFPDGVFITNDFVSAVVMQALKESNIRIPEQIAIVGFNNDSIGKLVSPRLTTINYPGSKIGEVAARSLINHLNGTGKIEQEETIIVNSELIVRESSLRKQL